MYDIIIALKTIDFLPIH